MIRHRKYRAPKKTVIVYFIDFDSYGWPSFGVDNSNNQVWRIPDAIDAGSDRLPGLGLGAPSDEAETSPLDSFHCGGFSVPNKNLLIRNSGAYPYAELGYPNTDSCVDYLGNYSISSNYSLLNSRYGTSIDPAEEDFQSLLYFLKENKPRNLKGIVLVPVNTGYSVTEAAKFYSQSPLFQARLEILKQRLIEEELQDLFVITEPQWSGQGDRILTSNLDWKYSLRGTCPAASQFSLTQECPFQPVQNEPVSPTPSYLDLFQSCTDEEIEQITTPCLVGDPDAEGPFGGEFNQGPISCAPRICHKDNCCTPIGPFGEGCQPGECICSEEILLLEKYPCTNFPDPEPRIVVCNNTGEELGPISEQCKCSIRYRDGQIEGWNDAEYNDLVNDLYWNRPAGTPFANDFSDVVIESIDQLLDEEETVEQILIMMSNKKSPPDSYVKHFGPGGSGHPNPIREFGQQSLDRVEAFYQWASENYPQANFSGPLNGVEFDASRFSFDNAFSASSYDVMVENVYLTINSIYDHYASEEVLSLKENLMVFYMEAFRKFLANEHQFLLPEIPPDPPFDPIGQPETNIIVPASLCWTYVPEITIENYKEYLSDIRGFGARFWYNFCPHSLFTIKQNIPTKIRFVKNLENSVLQNAFFLDDDFESVFSHIRKYTPPLTETGAVSSGSQKFVFPFVEETNLAQREVIPPTPLYFSGLFLQNIVNVIVKEFIFNIENPHYLVHRDETCKMIYSGKRTSIENGFFSWDEASEYHHIFQDYVRLQTQKGDPGNFFSFDDEVFYKPYQETYDIFQPYSYLQTDAGENSEDAYPLTMIRPMIGRSISSSLYAPANERYSHYEFGVGSPGPITYTPYGASSTDGQGYGGIENQSNYIDMTNPWGATPARFAWEDLIEWIDENQPQFPYRFWQSDAGDNWQERVRQEFPDLTTDPSVYNGVLGSWIRHSMFRTIGGASTRGVDKNNKIPYTGPYTPPWDFYSEPGVVHEEGSKYDSWYIDPNATSQHCNCWDSEVLAPYRSEGEE